MGGGGRTCAGRGKAGGEVSRGKKETYVLFVILQTIKTK